MQITDLIEKELDRYGTAGNPKPDCVYLGRKEHAELLKLAAHFTTLNGSPVDNEASRVEFRGLKVYSVDAATYVAFGTAQPSPCG